MDYTVLTEVAATAFAEVGWRFYLVFIIVPACGLPILWNFPETKGMSLEEIAVSLGDERPSGNEQSLAHPEKHLQVRGAPTLVEGYVGSRMLTNPHRIPVALLKLWRMLLLHVETKFNHIEGSLSDICSGIEWLWGQGCRASRCLPKYCTNIPRCPSTSPMYYQHHISTKHWAV